MGLMTIKNWFQFRRPHPNYWKVTLGIVFVGFGLAGLAMSFSRGEVPMSHLDSSDKFLESSFSNALTNVAEIRKKNRSSILDCTQFFAEFRHYQQTDPYIAFFKSIGIPIFTDNRNQRHYFGVELNHQQLWSMGYKDFMRNDRLVIVFTTTSLSSAEITSFKVSLLNT
jgi:hypothetical protein